MIIIDNAVEQMCKTYLSLPSRITGLGITRRQVNEAFETFPALLDAMETHASDKLNGIDLGIVDYYHRLRNELYHQGFGLTIERNKVETYSDVARVLFRNLFDYDVVGTTTSTTTTPPPDGSDQFLALVEKTNRIGQLAEEILESTGTIDSDARRMFPLSTLLSMLRGSGAVTEQQTIRLNELRQLRNVVVHGQIPATAITQEALDELDTLIGHLERELDRDG
ncbi:hypothetical protein LOC68_07070 [Blastopirellula sp. JC732]|uniref:Uncharacterized protein n=1 Tax=Blastopirellula sediminis TaxID=2894196 RepID=A0A9X1SG18_9BACT|nr:hypothetical protein [Blastopirellula sediminis]MCC9609072.1 hypothetical protein [Blastopirellula sediminis]MCC9628151.1 hypothetical protein [Blastopirellula sediminis]